MLLQIAPALAYILATIFIFTIAMRPKFIIHNFWVPAAMLSVLFLAFTIFTIGVEGLRLVIVNHTQNYWGNQVWFDLLIAVSIAFSALSFEARRLQMRLLPWAIFVILTASIGLLAMAARILYLRKDWEAL